MKRLLIIFIIIFHVQFSVADDTIIREDYSNGNINLQGNGAKIPSLLAQINALTGIKFIIDKSINDDTIFIDLQRVDFEKAINRLLKNYNKAFEYDESGKIKAVYIKPKSHQIKLVQQSFFPKAKIAKTLTSQSSNKSVVMEEVNINNSEDAEEVPNNSAYRDGDVLGMFVDNSNQMKPFNTTAPDTAHVEMEVIEFTGIPPGMD